MKFLYYRFVILAFLSLVLLSTNAGISSSVIKAQNFPVYNLNGERHVFYKMLAELPERGLMIVNFTSITCLPCKKEIPELKNTSEISEKIKLILIYAENSEGVKDNAASMGVAENAFVDPFGNIQKLYGVKQYPVTFVINKKYEIVGRFDGYTEANIKKIKQICFK